MSTFSAVAADEERMKTYILSPVPSILKRELDEYIVFRTSTFAARRQGGAVQSVSAEADKTALLRFYGANRHRTARARLPPTAAPRFTFIPHAPRVRLHASSRPRARRAAALPAAHDPRRSRRPRRAVRQLAAAHAACVRPNRNASARGGSDAVGRREAGCKFSTIANYLNGLVSIVHYCYANLEPTDAVLNSDPNPLAQIIVRATKRSNRATRTTKTAPHRAEDARRRRARRTYAGRRRRRPRRRRCTSSASAAGSRGVRVAWSHLAAPTALDARGGSHRCTQRTCKRRASPPSASSARRSGARPPRSVSHCAMRRRSASYRSSRLTASGASARQCPRDRMVECPPRLAPCARPHSLDTGPLCTCARAQLRLGHTLKKKAGGGWKMDLSKQRDGHKTSRFCIHATRSHAMPAHARACP